MSHDHSHDRDAVFAVWQSEYRGILSKIARAYATEPSDQADLFQEMLLQVWRSLASFREQAKPSTWIYRVCLNTALTWRRKVVRRERLMVTGSKYPQVASEVASPADSAGHREMLGKLYSAIQVLPDLDRALVLLLLDGLAYREIAEITGLTENHVGVALTRARKRLTALMKGASNELE